MVSVVMDPFVEKIADAEVAYDGMMAAALKVSVAEIDDERATILPHCRELVQERADVSPAIVAIARDRRLVPRLKLRLRA